MIMPNLGLLSVGAFALGLGTILSVKEQERKQLKCPKCGSTELKAKGGDLVCKKGHKITIDINQTKPGGFFSGISTIFR